MSSRSSPHKKGAPAPAKDASPAPAEEPFILTALVSLVFASVWMAREPELLEGFFYSPRLLALTHLVTLGFVTSIIMGVSVRLVPMTLGVEVRSRRLAWLQFGLYFIGGSGMVVHFLWAEWLAVAWAALLVGAALAIQLWNFSSCWRQARAGNWVARYLVAGQLQLLLAAFLGTALAMQNAHYRWPQALLGAPFLDRLSAHFHVAVVGWITSVIFGFELKLVPTTAGAGASLPLRFALLHGGVLALAACLLGGLPGRSAAALCIAIAIGWHALGPLRSLARRRDWFFEAAALAVLVALATLGVALSLGFPALGSELRLRVQLAYGYLALYGWVLVTVGAVAFKIFPLWVWKERFAKDLHRKPVPGVRELYSRRLAIASGSLLLAGVSSVVVGIVTPEPLALRAGLWVVCAGVVSFAFNFARVARWALLNLSYRPPG